MRSIPGLVFAVLLLFAKSCAANTGMPLQIRIDSVRLQHIGVEEVTADVQVTVTAPKGLHLQQLRMTNIHANGIPVFADTLQLGITTPGDPVALPPIHIHLYPQDIRDGDAMERTLREHAVTLTAVAYVDAQASFLQRLFVGERHPVAVWAVQRKVPLQIPDGLSRAGLSMLTLGLRFANSLNGRVRSGADTVTDTTGTARVRTCWTPRNSERRCTEHLAFAAGDRYLTAGEAVVPWLFDPLLSQLTPAAGTGVETVLLVGGAEIPVTVELTGKPRLRRVLLLPGKQWVSYAEPDSIYAELHTNTTVPDLEALPRAACTSTAWMPAQVYRLSADGHAVAALALQVQRAGELLQLSRPVDSSTAGSPIVMAEGVVGIVQGENAATVIAPAGACPIR